MLVSPFLPFLSSLHIHTRFPDWNENVVPRLLAIFRLVEREVKGQKQKRNIEMREQEFAEPSTQLIECYQPFLDSTTLRLAPRVQELLSEDDYRIPVTPERFSPIHGELALWADRELAPNYSAMANSFRSMHGSLLSPNTSGVSDREFLEKVVTMFGCKACKIVYDYRSHAKHGKECPKAIRARSFGSQGSGPAEKHAVVLALRLLQLLGLPEDSTRALVVQTLGETKFVCLCGNPKFRKQVGFFELVRPIPKSAPQISRLTVRFEFVGSKLRHLISESGAHEEVECQVRKGVNRSGSGEGAPNSDVSLINDHDPSTLPSLIRRIDPGQPQWKFETKPIDGHCLTKPHPAYCDLCFQLTGVRKFLGGDREYMLYHMRAK